jgi:hypothetical protein
MIVDLLLPQSTSAFKLKTNSGFCFQGITPIGKGFMVDEQIAQDWIEKDHANSEVIKLFSTGVNLTKYVNGIPDRWIIDLYDLSLEEMDEFPLPANHVRQFVKPERDKNRRDSYRVNWWKHGESRPALRDKLKQLNNYFAVPEVSKWSIYLFSSTSWLPGNLTRAVVSDDFYIFGLLSSNAHTEWVKAQSSTLEDRTRYTHNTCFETFPFPQAPSAKIVRQIRAKALELHQYRSDQMEQKQWGITKLYNAYFHEPASQLYKLHKQLDALVLQAYDFDPTDDLLEKLLALNLALAAKEQRGEPVVGPWDPTQPPSEV